MKQEIPIGQVDYTVLVKIRDTAGAAKTGLAYTDVDIAYARVETDNDVTTSDVTPATLANLTAAHSDWGFIEVSSTDHPGVYRLDIADAVFATGAWSAVVTVVGTGLDPADMEFILIDTTAAKFGTNVVQLAGSTTAATKLSASALTIGEVTIAASSTTTVIKTTSVSPAIVDTNQFSGRRLVILSTTTTTGLRIQAARIESVDSGTGDITLVTADALTQAPASGDLAVIV